MKEAAKRVVSRQMSPCEAASAFGVAKTTLFRSVRKLKSASDATSVSFAPNYSVHQIFTDEQESLIASYLYHLQASQVRISQE